MHTNLEALISKGLIWGILQTHTHTHLWKLSHKENCLCSSHIYGVKVSVLYSGTGPWRPIFYIYFEQLHWDHIPYIVVIVQSLNHVQLFTTPWTAAHQASLSFTISQNLLKLMSIVLMMSSNHLILWHLLLLLPSVFPSIRYFPNESSLHIRWPKY